MLWNHASYDSPEKYGAVAGGGSKLAEAWATGRGAQIGFQAMAATISAVYAFVLTLVLVKVIDLFWTFRLAPEAENAGLDHTEHNEVGFDLSSATEELSEATAPEPRPATAPPDGGGRYTIVVNGPTYGEMMTAWSGMCQKGATPPTPEFRAVYPHFTTVQGNRFRFHGGDRQQMRNNVQRLFQDCLGTTVQTHVEE